MTKPQIKKTGICATGRRKSSIASACIVSGNGQLDYMSKSTITESDKKYILSSLEIIDKTKNYNVIINVNGGGIRGQIDAARLAVARAVVKIDQDAQTVISKNGLLTRDSRVKERKKPGLKRARRAPQWAKR